MCTLSNLKITRGDVMSKTLDVVGLGNALMDVVVLLPDDSFLNKKNLNKGEMQLVDDAQWQGIYSDLGELKADIKTGGSCANTITTLGLLGASVSYCSQVGSDDLGRSYASQLEDACGRHHLVVSDSVATGKCLSLVSKDAERTMMTDLGAAVQLGSVEHYKEATASAKVLYLTGYLMFGSTRDHMLDLIKTAKAAGVKIGFDVADPSVVSALKQDMFEIIRDHVDIVFLNKAEAAALCGGEPEDAIAQLREMCEVVVVKLGGKGSMACRGDEEVKVGIYKVKAIDTTGAGDSYAAGFLYGLVNDWPLIQCAQLGSRVASEAVAQLGAVVREPEVLASCVAEIRGQ